MSTTWRQVSVGGIMLESIRRGLRAAVVFLVHLILGGVIALGLRGFLSVWTLLFDGHEPKVAGLFPMVYILEIGDACILAVFVVFGTVEAVKAFTTAH
jgi:hypothetical protein